MYPAAVAVAHFTRAETWAAALTGAWLLIRLLNDASARAERRSRAETLRALAESRCPRCSSVYGMAAAQCAERENEEARWAVREELSEGDDTFLCRAPWEGRFPLWTANCPQCGGAWEFATGSRRMCDRRLFRQDDPEADEIARRNGVRIPTPIPDPVPGAEWGEALCAGCGARKRHWADTAHGRCSRCGEPLGEPPPQEEREEEGEVGPWP